jgi:hypothetical protein
MSTWIEPRRWATGEHITEERLNRELSGNMRWLHAQLVPLVVVEDTNVAEVTLEIPDNAPTNLKLIVSARGDTTADTTELRLQYNGVTTTRYDNLRLTISGTGQTVNENAGETFHRLGLIPAANTAGAHIGKTALEIYNHNEGVFNGGQLHNIHFGTAIAYQRNSLVFRSVQSLTSIRLFPQAGNFLIVNAALWGLIR